MQKCKQPRYYTLLASLQYVTLDIMQQKQKHQTYISLNIVLNSETQNKSLQTQFTVMQRFGGRRKSLYLILFPLKYYLL